MLSKLLSPLFSKPTSSFIYNDGGRKAAGYKGNPGDCVIRAIAIAADMPYNDVYEGMRQRNKQYRDSHNNKVSRQLKKRGTSPRNGNYKEVYEPYILELGFTWVPLSGIGMSDDKRTKLGRDKMPNGTVILRLGKHLCACIDGVVHDKFNPAENSTRQVYGYWIKK